MLETTLSEEPGIEGSDNFKPWSGRRYIFHLLQYYAPTHKSLKEREEKRIPKIVVALKVLAKYVNQGRFYCTVTC